MKRTSLVILIVFVGLVALYALVRKNDNLPPNSKGMRMAASLELSGEELFKVKKDALLGSPAAGYQLVQYYSVYKGDNEQVMYWAQIAAENGAANNAFNYASFLSDDKGNVMSLIRARFWAERAIEKGETLLGKGLLSDIDKKIKNLESKTLE